NNRKYKLILSSVVATSGICLPVIAISASATNETVSAQGDNVDPLQTSKDEVTNIITADAQLSPAQKEAFNTQVSNAKNDDELNKIKTEINALNELVQEISTFDSLATSYEYKLSTKAQQDAFTKAFTELDETKKTYVQSIVNKTYAATTAQAISTELKDLLAAYNQLSGIKTYEIIQDALTNEAIIRAYSSKNATILDPAFATLKEVQTTALTAETVFDLNKINSAIETIGQENIIASIQISNSRKQLDDALQTATANPAIPYISTLISFGKGLLLNDGKIVATPAAALDTVYAELNTLLKEAPTVADLSNLVSNTNSQISALESFKTSDNKALASLAEKVAAIITLYANAATKASNDYNKNLQDNLINFIVESNKQVASLSLEAYNTQLAKYNQTINAPLEELKATITPLVQTFDPLFAQTIDLVTEMDKATAEVKATAQYANTTQYLKTQIDSLNQELKKTLAEASEIDSQFPGFPAFLNADNSNFNYKYVDALNTLQDIETKFANTKAEISKFPDTPLVNGKQAAVIELEQKLSIFTPAAKELFGKQFQTLPTYEATLGFIAKASDYNTIVNKLFVYSTKSLDSSTSSLNVLISDLGTSEKVTPAENNLSVDSSALISLAGDNSDADFQTALDSITNAFTNLQEFMYQINKFENSKFDTNSQFQDSLLAVTNAITKFSEDIQENAQLSSLFNSVIDLDAFNAANTIRIKDNTLYVKLIGAIESKNVAEFNTLAEEQTSDPRIINLVKYIKETNYLKYTQIPAVKLTTHDRNIMNNIINTKEFYGLSPIAQDAVKFDYPVQRQGFWIAIGVLGAIVATFGFALLFVKKAKRNK
ncbi:GA module-containing protein, partial [Mycoplasma sp. Z244B]|uniref:GA module-containing protein n=1 Tax=Mycoplasma sp. Z244B TaxID=3401659 RepID=UPI003AAB32FF